MDAERWRRIADIFDMVVELPAEERPRVLAQVCGEDDVLLREAQRLLDADLPSNSSLSTASKIPGSSGRVQTYLTPGTVIDDRYVITQFIGAGGMGAVYSAKDQVSGEQVALKRLSGAFDRALMSDQSKLGNHIDLMVLAREFRMAASVQHPNIVAVLDYGFDALGSPYLIMELLDAALDIGQACKTRDFECKVCLLIYLAEALGFLHRRGILHGDIKLANVLVKGDVLRVVDFGIAAFLGTAASGWGTPSYMAPEVTAGNPVTARADLYSMGVIAKHIFADEVSQTPLGDIVRLSLLQSIIAKLTAFDPHDRYADAWDASEDLHQCIGRRAPNREVYTDQLLAISPVMIERQTELHKLCDALPVPQARAGSIWLISGPAGIGKSRLLEEFRIRALIANCRVLQGSSSRTSGYPYHLWRQIFAQSLVSPLANDKAVGTIRAILSHQASNEGGGASFPSSDPGSVAITPHQVSSAVEELFAYQHRPTVLLLEDVQWADPESIALMQEAATWTSRLPLMLIATSREPPADYLTSLKQSSRIILEPLSNAGLASLMDLVIGGDVADRERCLSQLYESSGGNPLFAVQTLRSIAGSRHFEGSTLTSSADLFRPTIEQLVTDRLNLMSEVARQTLQIAAVTGRRIDIPILRLMLDPQVLDSVLQLGDELGIIDRYEGHWRFSHDTVRDVLVREIPSDKLRDHHAAIALAIESAGELSHESPRLAYHWAEGGRLDKEREYSVLAGSEMLRLAAYQRAIAYFERSLQLIYTLGDEDERRNAELNLSLQLGSAYLVAKGFSSPHAKSAFDRAHAISFKAGQVSRTFDALFGQAASRLFRGEIVASQELGSQCLSLAQRSQNAQMMIRALFTIGNAQYWLGDFREAFRNYEKILSLLDDIGQSCVPFDLGLNPRVTAATFGAWSSWAIGLPLKALEIATETLDIAEQLNHPFCTAMALHILAIVYQHRLDLPDTLRCSEQLSALSSEFPIYSVAGEIFGGWALVRSGEKHSGRLKVDRAVQRWRDLEAGLARTYFAVLVAEVFAETEDQQLALNHIQKSLVEMRHFDERSHESEIYRVRGNLSIAMGRAREGEADLLRSISISRRQGARGFELRASSDLANLWKSHGRLQEARRLISDIYTCFLEGLDTVDCRRARELLGAIHESP